jgi:hypothetical protein
MATYLIYLINTRIPYLFIKSATLLGIFKIKDGRENRRKTTNVIRMEGFEAFETELKDLVPEVREKALELAGQYLNKQGYNKARAIKEGIADAQAWFMESEG